MNYTFDTSQATPETRRWVEYTPEQIRAMSTPAAGGGGGFTPGTFNPSMTYDQWANDMYAKNLQSKLTDRSGASYAFTPTQSQYQAYVDAERKQWEADQLSQMLAAGGQGGGGGMTYSGPGGYWDITPGTAGKLVASQKTGSDRLIDWTALDPNVDYEQARKSVEDALFSRLEPALQRDRESLLNRLANQGLMLGTDRYDQGVDEFNRQATDARMQAILAGGQEQSRLFNMDLSRAGFNNTTRIQQFQEALARRNQPLNEIIALLSGSQVQGPQFIGANLGPIPTTDNAGIIANYDNQKLQAAQMQNQMTGNILGGLFSFGGKLIGGLG